MRRILAFVLTSALASSSTATSLLHVHEYAGHDHPDHHHGPAIHEHEHSATADHDHHVPPTEDHDSVVEAESCDPGRHTVSVTVACAHVPRVHVDLAELPGPTVATPTGPIRSALPVRDVRVHGPPFDARIPSRAPPVMPHA